MHRTRRSTVVKAGDGCTLAAARARGCTYVWGGASTINVIVIGEHVHGLIHCGGGITFLECLSGGGGGGGGGGGNFEFLIFREQHFFLRKGL